MIVLMAGLPGTGKSTLARAAATDLGAAVLSKDEIRHAIFSPAEVEYSTKQDDFVMQLMLQASGWLLEKNPSRIVCLDGRTFSRSYQIDQVIDAAGELRQPWRIIECVCSEQSARLRLETHAASGEHPAGNRDFQLYLRVKAYFEPITRPKVVIDTDQSLDQCVHRMISALK